MADRWCADGSEELVRILEGSWAWEALVPLYYIYIKMAYHLPQETRAGLSEFRIPRDFGRRLFEFQTAAVKIKGKTKMLERVKSRLVPEAFLSTRRPITPRLCQP